MIPRVPASRAGFTLIEVIGALLIFSTGVIMLLRITGALSTSLEHSAINSVIAAEGQERVDSLSALGYASLATGTTTSSPTVRGIPYTQTQVISQYSPLVKEVVVTLARTTGTGPTFSATFYVADPW